MSRSDDFMHWIWVWFSFPLFFLVIFIPPKWTCLFVTLFTPGPQYISNNCYTALQHTLDYFYTIVTQLFFKIRQYCLFLRNWVHLCMPPTFGFCKVTVFLTLALLLWNILSPSETFRLVTNNMFLLNSKKQLYCLSKHTKNILIHIF